MNRHNNIKEIIQLVIQGYCTAV